MCPRTRQIADQQIAETAAALLAEAGAAALTFAEVSKRCGLAPPTLVQRFGTREAMVMAAVNAATRRLPLMFASARSLEGALQASMPLVRAMLGAPPSQATAGFSKELKKQISYSIARMVDRGELPRCDIAKLARAVQFAFIGAVAAAALAEEDAQEAIRFAVQSQVEFFV
jgi:AcrR family transcriptional regulator